MPATAARLAITVEGTTRRSSPSCPPTTRSNALTRCLWTAPRQTTGEAHRGVKRTPRAMPPATVIVRTFTATDDAGNSSSASQTITVEDTTAPEFPRACRYTVECSDEMLMDDATASAEKHHRGQETTAGDAAGNYVIVAPPPPTMLATAVARRPSPWKTPQRRSSPSCCRLHGRML